MHALIPQRRDTYTYTCPNCSARSRSVLLKRRHQECRRWCARQSVGSATELLACCLAVLTLMFVPEHNSKKTSSISVGTPIAFLMQACIGKQQRNDLAKIASSFTLLETRQTLRAVASLLHTTTAQHRAENSQTTSRCPTSNQCLYSQPNENADGKSFDICMVIMANQSAPRTSIDTEFKRGSCSLNHIQNGSFLQMLEKFTQI